jgi:hypothetical protein
MTTSLPSRSPFTLIWLVLGVATVAPAQITEWPGTVAPGRFLLEMDAVSLTIDREGGDRFTGFGAASTFLTTGLTENLDVQIGAELFIMQEFKSTGLRQRDSGLGDVYVRTKWRFLNDPETGRSAALLPYVKLPTNSGGVGNDAIEGGVIMPWETRWPGGLTLNAMAQVDLLRNDQDDGYDLQAYAALALRREFTSVFGAYGEMTGGKSAGGGSFAGTIGAGVTLALTANTWWDLAVYRGFSRGAADWNPVVRFNWGF